LTALNEAKMSVFKTKWFDKWASKQGLTSDGLCTAVHEMSAGLYEADLGGGLFKKRVARPGQGKSGGFRTLVATKKLGRWVFVYGFPKKASVATSTKTRKRKRL
jgi:hypothetical protein